MLKLLNSTRIALAQSTPITGAYHHPARGAPATLTPVNHCPCDICNKKHIDI
ncbi:hypothetical protein GPEL0_01f3407 [Geoanaerobacter pelophilus]|uniref:Uncharacterized protein n=1 Tax=Geoanaerobacter pelophilus TaxID=60036 RepID=A0ABQ0MKC3_9BACT|nr:hypothetical protein GPEL0_01f3407 [Geoanaerobacter pelophilus]